MMTRRLILIRHAKSDWGDAALDDHDRPLNDRGTRSAAAIGDWLAARDIRPDALLCSTARRTRETWAGISANLAASTAEHFLPELYHASADRILAAVHGMTDPTIMLIGHNPGIGDTANRIVADPPRHPRFADYPTGATLVVDFRTDDWRGVLWGTGQVAEFVVPRDLD